MANSSSAKKRSRQAKVRRLHNSALRSMVRTFIKKVVRAIATKDVVIAKIKYAEAVPVIDRMVNKGIIHKNKAARHKGRLAAQIKSLSK